MKLSWEEIFGLVGIATGQTALMVLFSTIFSVLLGFPLGILLCTSEPVNGIAPKPALNQVLSRIVNIVRSFPFIILIILLFPLSRLIVHTTIGTKATIVPLSIAAAPFVARVIESSLKEVDVGVIQAARSMGSTNRQIIFKVMIPEALPSLVDGITLTVINLIGYSAMAGVVGGGGLGQLANSYGYQRFETRVLAAAVIVIILMVELIQALGSFISGRIKARR